MRAVLFDMDGTLVDTPGGIVSILRSMFPDLADEAARSFVGLPLTRIMATLCQDDVDSAAVLAACAGFRARFTEEVVPRARELVFDGVVEMLDHLHEIGVAVAVVTSKGTRGAEEMLRAAGLRDAVDVLVGYEEGRAGKPAPDQALSAATALVLTPADCLVVGDSVDDVRMARAAGMRVVGVGYGVAGVGELMGAGADTVVTVPQALGDLLVRMIPPASRALLTGRTERSLEVETARPVVACLPVGDLDEAAMVPA